MRASALFPLVLAATLGAACSSQQTYATGQTWQRNECNKIIDPTDRQRCTARANESYDNYQRQVDDVKKGNRAD